MENQQQQATCTGNPKSGQGWRLAGGGLVVLQWGANAVANCKKGTVAGLTKCGPGPNDWHAPGHAVAAEAPRAEEPAKDPVGKGGKGGDKDPAGKGKGTEGTQGK